jgi:hypothetical protein
MPVRFTCRLLVVRTETGKLRVEYGCLEDECVQMLTVHGPRMVFPPSQEMTDEEFSRWEFELVAGTGFYYSCGHTPLSAAIVEARRTYDDVIPKGSVRSELSWVQNEAGERTLGVRVANGWFRQIPNFSLATVCRYEAPQPVDLGTVPAQALGGSEQMFRRLGASGDGDLWAGMTADFILDPRAMGPLRSRVASLSTECYWIVLLTDGHEFDRIPGEIVGAFLEEDAG